MITDGLGLLAEVFMRDGDQVMCEKTGCIELTPFVVEVVTFGGDVDGAKKAMALCPPHIAGLLETVET